MASVIARDFAATPIGEGDGAFLLGALRKGGTEVIKTPHGAYQRHEMGAWHFILASGTGASFATRQWHIPRYLMAREMALRLRVFEQFGDRSASPIRGNFFGLPTLMANKKDLRVLRADGGAIRISAKFTAKLVAEAALLEKAATKVREVDSRYRLPRLRTPAGHPVESDSRQLVEGIAFEATIYPKLIAGNFGLFSAFCTSRDFETFLEMSDELLRELLESQFNCEPETVTDELHELFMKTQRQLFARPFWGRGIKLALQDAVPILARGMATLSRHQRAQLVLANGMHGAGLLLTLATVTGIGSFEYYADQVCLDFQPDSPEEQDRRTQIAYLRLYGEVAPAGS
jgi:hypothetical protein